MKKKSVSKMNQQNIPTEIESLLKTKSYDDLNSIEKQEVERFLDPKEYEAMRRIILQSIASFHDDGEKLNISPAIEDSLMNAFKEKNIEKHSYSFKEALSNIFNYRIPMYRAALAVGLLFIAVNFFEFTGGVNKSIAATDTVYIKVPETILLQESQIHQRRLDISQAAQEVISEVKNIVNNTATKDLALNKPIAKFKHELVRTDRIVKNFASNFENILGNSKRGSALKEDSVIKHLLLN
jgi:hypothetical protein